jgi:hypothetical protein
VLGYRNAYSSYSKAFDRASSLKRLHSRLIFGRCLVRISYESPTSFITVYVGFSQSLQAIARTVYCIRSRPLLYISLRINQSLIVVLFDAVLSDIPRLRPALNETITHGLNTKFFHRFTLKVKALLSSKRWKLFTNRHSVTSQKAPIVVLEKICINSVVTNYVPPPFAIHAYF